MSLPFVVTSHSYGLGNVLGLGRLTAAQEKKEQSIPANRVLDVIAGADIDLQFGNPVREIAMDPGVAMNEAINSHEDAGTTDDIRQVVNPIAVLVCLLDSHAKSVAHGLHTAPGLL